MVFLLHPRRTSYFDRRTPIMRDQLSSFALSLSLPLCRSRTRGASPRPRLAPPSIADAVSLLAVNSRLSRRERCRGQAVSSWFAASTPSNFRDTDFEVACAIGAPPDPAGGRSISSAKPVNASFRITRLPRRALRRTFTLPRPRYRLPRLAYI